MCLTELGSNSIYVSAQLQTRSTDTGSHPSLPDSIVPWLSDGVTGLEAAFAKLAGSLKLFLRHNGGEPALRERQRDIFPLPLVSVAFLHELNFTVRVEDETLKDVIV